jgi:hypothetical protein
MSGHAHRARNPDREFHIVLERFGIGVNSERQHGRLRDIPTPNSPYWVDIPETIDYEAYSPPAPPSVAELRESYFTQNLQSLLGHPPPAISTSDSSTAGDSESDPAPGRSPPLLPTITPQFSPRLSDADADAAAVADGLPGESRFGARRAFRQQAAFAAHRDGLEEFYRALSDELGLKVPRHICQVPTCVGAALPGSAFCFGHLGLDPDFKHFRLFRRCQSFDGERRCSVPVSLRDATCNGHRSPAPPK